jgi:hypothetical protein
MAGIPELLNLSYNAMLTGAEQQRCTANDLIAFSLHLS